MARRAISATQARIHFGELMRGVSEKDEVIVVERGGKPLIVLLSVEAYERLQTQKEKVHWSDMVLRAQARIKKELGRQKLKPAEEIIRETREERDARKLGLR